MKNVIFGDWIVLREISLSYIIMYFCVFRGEMLRNGDLFNYFRDKILNKINDISDAFGIFSSWSLLYFDSKKICSRDIYIFKWIP